MEYHDVVLVERNICAVASYSRIRVAKGKYFSIRRKQGLAVKLAFELVTLLRKCD